MNVTRYPPPPKAFTCAICQQHRDYRWPGSVQDWPVEPICIVCEEHYCVKIRVGGSLRDRRKVRVLGALISALWTKANCMEWEKKYGFS